MKPHAQLLAPLLGTCLCLAGCTSCSNEAAQSHPSMSASTSLGASASVAKPALPPPPKGQGQKGTIRATLRQLPGIDELYAQAKERGVAGDLFKTVQVKAKSFSTMGESERPIEVGMFLASVAIVSSDPENDIPLPVLEDAEKAINSLRPPQEVVKYMSEMIAAVKKGLKGKELRQAIDRMMAQGVPFMDADPAFATTARLLRLGAYLRTMGLLSKALGATKDTGKFLVLSQRPDHEFHIETVAMLSESMKKDALVKKVEEALNKAKSAVFKPDPGADDARLIAVAMAPFTD